MSQPSLTSTPGGLSPWAFLGATSGAPTPSLDGPGRFSPHLGGPFEQLNLNGSWSLGNLGEGSGTTEGSGMDVESSAKPQPSVVAPQPTKPLPAALARRRGSLPKASLGIGMTSTKAPSPLGSTSSGPGLNPLSASDVSKYLLNPSTLIMDVRPPSAYLSGHLPKSHSIPIPSTLIRRPAFTVAKVLLMLSGESRNAVSGWKEATNIILLDVDSTSAGPGTLLEGLASKFTREGFGGKLWFVKGGQNALESTGLPMVSVETPVEEMGSPGPGAMSPSGNFSAGGLGSFAFLHG